MSDEKKTHGLTDAEWLKMLDEVPTWRAECVRVLITTACDERLSPDDRLLVIANLEEAINLEIIPLDMVELPRLIRDVMLSIMRGGQNLRCVIDEPHQQYERQARERVEGARQLLRLAHKCVHRHTVQVPPPPKGLPS